MKLFRLLFGFPRGLILGFGSAGPVMLVLALTNSIAIKTWVAIEAQFAALLVYALLVGRELYRESIKAGGHITAAVKKSDDLTLQEGFITLFVDREGVRRCPHCKHSVESEKNVEEWEKNAP